MARKTQVKGKSKEKPQKMPVVRAPVKKQRATPKGAVGKRTPLSVDIWGPKGEITGTMDLPSAWFGSKINRTLIAQAVRVYLANQRQGGANTKTRGEVEGSTRKIYRQKGTGKARHGSIRAPIFVGGGIVFGPKRRDYSLKFPKEMKRQALMGALSWAQKENMVKVVEGMNTLPPKTREFAKLFEKMQINKGVLLVLTDMSSPVAPGSRNLPYIDIASAANLTTYDVVTHRTIIFETQAIDTLSKRGKEKV